MHWKSTSLLFEYLGGGWGVVRSGSFWKIKVKKSKTQLISFHWWSFIKTVPGVRVKRAINLETDMTNCIYAYLIKRHQQINSSIWVMCLFFFKYFLMKLPSISFIINIVFHSRNNPLLFFFVKEWSWEYIPTQLKQPILLTKKQT